MSVNAAKMARAEQAARIYFENLPDDVTLHQAMALPFSGERNLAVRRALGIRFPSNVTVLVTDGDVIQIAGINRTAAKTHANAITTALDGYTTKTGTHPDGKLVLWALPPGYDDDLELD